MADRRTVIARLVDQVKALEAGTVNFQLATPRQSDSDPPPSDPSQDIADRKILVYFSGADNGPSVSLPVAITEGLVIRVHNDNAPSTMRSIAFVDASSFEIATVAAGETRTFVYSGGDWYSLLGF